MHIKEKKCNFALGIEKQVLRKMKKIFNYILTVCLASLVMACNAQQQKREKNERDSTKSCGHTDVLPSSGKLTDKDEVLRSCPDHPWAEHRTYGPNDVHEIATKMPSYPGGFQELFKYLQNNINYPPQATIAHIEGRVIVAFIVEKDGSLTGVRIAKSVHPSLDEEAVRVVSAMPNWIPGEEDGHPVRVRYVLPITFNLKEK